MAKIRLKAMIRATLIVIAYLLAAIILVAVVTFLKTHFPGFGIIVLVVVLSIMWHLEYRKHKNDPS